MVIVALLARPALAVLRGVTVNRYRTVASRPVSVAEARWLLR